MPGRRSENLVDRCSGLSVSCTTTTYMGSRGRQGGTWASFSWTRLQLEKLRSCCTFRRPRLVDPLAGLSAVPPAARQVGETPDPLAARRELRRLLREQNA